MFKPYLPILGVLSATLLFGCATFHKAESTAEYEPVVTVFRPVKGVPVIVSYQGGAFYRVQVNNTLPTAIKLLWDESAYVNTSGESVRIIRILDKRNLPGGSLPAQQADSPIAPDSQLQADFIGESWIEFARRGGTPKPKDSFKKAKIHLLFNINGKRVDWRGEVAFVPKKPLDMVRGCAGRVSC